MANNQCPLAPVKPGQRINGRLVGGYGFWLITGQLSDARVRTFEKKVKKQVKGKLILKTFKVRKCIINWRGEARYASLSQIVNLAILAVLGAKKRPSSNSEAFRLEVQEEVRKHWVVFDKDTQAWVSNFNLDTDLLRATIDELVKRGNIKRHFSGGFRGQIEFTKFPEFRFQEV